MDGDAIITMSLDLKKGLLVAIYCSYIMSNMGRCFARHGIIVKPVGDRYVLKMLRSGLLGEQSGHVIMLQHNTTGDGLITAVRCKGVKK